MRPQALPPQPRESSHALHPRIGPGAEGGGGWPMHATAQSWHAEGRPLTTEALRRLRSLATLPAASPMQRNRTHRAATRCSTDQRFGQLREILESTNALFNEATFP
jgi:hypothetical protein